MKKEYFKGEMVRYKSHENINKISIGVIESVTIMGSLDYYIYYINGLPYSLSMIIGKVSKNELFIKRKLL